MNLSFDILTRGKTIRVLLDQIFGEQKVPRGTVKWLEQNPDGYNQWYTAYDNGKPIALYGMLRRTLRIGKERYPSYLCNNVGVIPEYRSQGVFTRLGEFATANLSDQYLFGIPNLAALHSHSRVGWDIIGTLELLRGKSSKMNISKSTWTNDDPQKFRLDLHRDPAFIGFERAPKSTWWRYSKPGETYFQTHLGDMYVVWKRYNDAYQVMECNPFIAPYLLFPDDQEFEFWSLKGTTQNKIYKQMGFESRMDRFLITKNFQNKIELDSLRFELTESDNF